MLRFYKRFKSTRVEGIHRLKWESGWLIETFGDELSGWVFVVDVTRWG